MYTNYIYKYVIAYFDNKTSFKKLVNWNDEQKKIYNDVYDFKIYFLKRNLTIIESHIVNYI